MKIKTITIKSDGSLFFLGRHRENYSYFNHSLEGIVHDSIPNINLNSHQFVFSELENKNGKQVIMSFELDEFKFFKK